MDTPTKACTRCGDVKPLNDFPRDRRRRDGRQSWCRECCRAAVRARRTDPEYREREAAAKSARRADPEYRERERAADAARKRARRAAYAARADEQVARDRARLRPGGLKRCKSCRELLPLDAFSANRCSADGLCDTCRLCDHADLVRAALPHIEETDCWTCAYCSAPIEHVDHIQPRALGGTDEPHNLIGACAECNGSKSATPVLEWLARRDLELVARVSSWSVEVVA